MDQYDLVLGLPHTNHLGLAEHLLLMHAGHFQWTSIARAIGAPLSSLRTVKGREVYATFFYIEERFPDDASIDTFRLDDRLQFAVFLRAFKEIAVEGKIVFNRESRIRDWLNSAPTALSDEDTERHPFIHFANIFITPEAGNSRLRIANPAGVDLSMLPNLPNAENPYVVTKLAGETGKLGLIGDAWERIDRLEDFEAPYAVDVDRDTNGAGLVYFANYVSFMDRAEREAMRGNSRRHFDEAQISGRVVRHRRIAYYGNVATDDRIRTRVSMFQHNEHSSMMAFRYEMRRGEDSQLICLSEAVKVLTDVGSTSEAAASTALSGKEAV